MSEPVIVFIVVVFWIIAEQIIKVWREHLRLKRRDALWNKVEKILDKRKPKP